MLTGKQIRFLRKKAHHLKPIFQIGKSGINENMTEQIKEALEARELIKVSVLQNATEETEEAASKLAESTRSEIVQVIGSTIILYRQSVNKKEIELPSR